MNTNQTDTSKATATASNQFPQLMCAKSGTGHGMLLVLMHEPGIGTIVAGEHHFECDGNDRVGGVGSKNWHWDMRAFEPFDLLSEHSALSAVAEAAQIVSQSGPLHNGMKDEAALSQLAEALAALAEIRGK